MQCTPLQHGETEVSLRPRICAGQEEFGAFTRFRVQRFQVLQFFDFHLFGHLS